jgi:hypothetical protein
MGFSSVEGSKASNIFPTVRNGAVAGDISSAMVEGLDLNKATISMPIRERRFSHG